MTPGVPEGGCLPDGAGAAGVDQGRGAPIRSSPGGQDEAIDPPMTFLRLREGQIHTNVTSFCF